jgi:uncharacterized membrane protein YhaH (DUF805 family)
MDGDVTDTEERSPESRTGRGLPTWRTACVFALLALVLGINLANAAWTIPGPEGVIIEAVIKFLAWLYILALCGLSLSLGVRALRRYRQQGDRAGTRMSLVALIIGVLVVLLTYRAYWTS